MSKNPEAEKLMDGLNDLEFSTGFADEKSKIRSLRRIVVGLRGKLNEIWTDFKYDFNAKMSRANVLTNKLNGVEMRPKAKPEAQAQNFRVGNNVGVRSEFFQREGATLGPSIFVENVDQHVRPQSSHFTWEKAGTSGGSAALEQPPGSTAQGRTQSKYKQSQRQVNLAHGQSQNTHVNNDSMPTSLFQNFISDPTADILPDSKDHYLESAETTPMRGALDFNKSFECRVDIDVPFSGPLSAKSEYCMDFYETVSNEILWPKNENCGTVLDKAVSCFESENCGTILDKAVSCFESENCGTILDKEVSCFESENLNENFRNAVPGILNAKSEQFSGLNPRSVGSPNGILNAKSENFSGLNSRNVILNDSKSENFSGLNSRHVISNGVPCSKSENFSE